MQLSLKLTTPKYEAITSAALSEEPTDFDISRTGIPLGERMSTFALLLCPCCPA
jgi:hypothetical protein